MTLETNNIKALEITRGDDYIIFVSVMDRETCDMPNLQGSSGQLVVKANVNDKIADAIIVKDYYAVTQSFTETIIVAGAPAATITGTATNFPIHPGSLTIDVEINSIVESGADDYDTKVLDSEGEPTAIGVISGNNFTGTIDYATGEITITADTGNVTAVSFDLGYTYFDSNFTSDFDFGCGEMLFRLDAADTDLLSLQKYFWDVQITDTLGIKSTPVVADLYVRGDINSTL